MIDSDFDLIDRLDRHKPADFIAPILDAERVQVRVLLGGIPYSFTVRSAEPGWWVLHPNKAKTKARCLRQVDSMTTVFDYLRVLPRFVVIALFRIRTSTWLVMPWNAADAEQRRWPNAWPRQVHLVRHLVQPFDVLEVRELGSELIHHLRACSSDYSRLGRLLRESLVRVTSPGLLWEISGVTRELVSAWRILRGHMDEQLQQAKLQEAARKRMSVEESLRWHLDFMGAELTSWYEAVEGYRLYWTYEGQEYGPVDVKRNLFTQSAGVCLDETDHRHNLSAMVDILAEHRRLGRTV